MRIFIIGYMGSGKTTQGKRLANKLGLDFFDLDQEIESCYHMSIEHIFKQFGEDVFRQIETKQLTEFFQKDNFVLSAGGGTPCFFDNIKWMNQTGITIYLQLQAGVLASRLLASKIKRPLLDGKNEQEFHDFIARQLNNRELFYLQARYIVDAMDFDVNRMAQILTSNAIFST